MHVTLPAHTANEIKMTAMMMTNIQMKIIHTRTFQKATSFSSLLIQHNVLS